MGGRRWLVLAVLVLTLPFLGGCGSIGPTDARILRHHHRQMLRSIEELTRRLYAKNPKYEPNPVRRQKKLAQIFGRASLLSRYRAMPSHEVLTEAFSPEPGDPDRVFLLGLGLVKSIRETYETQDGLPVVVGLQIPLERLERLHRNISQVNWRLKTYRDQDGRLLFLTNAPLRDGGLNMGYEVLMTSILTRIEDDIYLRGGLPQKYAFNASTLFVSLLF